LVRYLNGSKEIFVFGGKYTTFSFVNFHGDLWSLRWGSGINAICPFNFHSFTMLSLFFAHMISWKEGELNWKRLSTSGQRPSARSGHTATFIDPVGTRGPSLVLFGGNDGIRFLNDLYILDIGII
jgi:hypothetical protein